jgi:hypothetical protein
MIMGCTFWDFFGERRNGVQRGTWRFMVFNKSDFLFFHGSRSRVLLSARGDTTLIHLYKHFAWDATTVGLHFALYC